MLFNFLFCCSNSKIKDNKAITFEQLNSNEENNNNIDRNIPPCVNMDRNRNNFIKDNLEFNNINIDNDNNNNENCINFNVNNIHHLVNNINNINVINNNNYYTRERSNKLVQNNNNFNSISNKSSFKSLLVRNYNNSQYNNNQNNISINKFKNNNNINNFPNNNFQKTQSILSFSNLIVAKNTKTNNNDDTEILSPYELVLSGEIFFNKEIKIDRLGIKSNKIGDKRMRKEHLIKFGILINNKNKDSDFNTSDYKCKYEKECDKFSQNLKELNSISSSFNLRKEHNLDMILNIDKDKVSKFLDQYEQIIGSENKEDDIYSSPKLKKDNKTITLFTIRYIASMELFEFCSTHNIIPVELLLDHEYQLRNGYDYNILLGEVCIVLKVLKNINDEDILKIRIKDKLEEKINSDNINMNNSLNKKQEEIYNFSSSNNLNRYITIGRKNCTININNETLSDTHFKIRYSNNTDTFSVIDNVSQNGSYLLLNEPFNFLYIKNVLSFRIFDSKFKIKFIHNSE